MGTTLTVRTDDRLREALTRKAETLGKTVSQLVREILEDAIAERPMAGRIGHLRGALRLDRRLSTGVCPDDVPRHRVCTESR
jgi:hypothetical protein